MSVTDTEPRPSSSASRQTSQSSTAVDPTVRARVRPWVGPLAVVLLVLLVVGVAAVVGSGGPQGYLDPDAATPAGGRALRVLLEERGVAVQAVSTTADAASSTGAAGGRTLLVAQSAELTTDQLRQLSSDGGGSSAGSDLVVLDPDDRVLSTLAPGLVPGRLVVDDVRQPACTLPAAQRAGTALAGGLEMSAQPGTTATLCYPRGDGTAGLVAQLAGPSGSGWRTVTVVGSGDAFTNGELANDGNAALALDLLGGHERLTWYVGRTELPPGGGDEQAGDLLPTWVPVAVLQLCVVVLLAAFWRGRRLGPVVDEVMPADVPAAEATEGRARLYRRRRARDQAARHLRDAAVARLRPALGLPRTGGVDPQAVVTATAARAGWSAADVAALLYGAAPADDAALVRLASDLDSLERQVSRR